MQSCPEVYRSSWPERRIVSRRNGVFLLVSALVCWAVAVPVVAGAVGPSDGCPAGAWELIAVADADGSVAAKAEARDARGNGDGFVCQKENRAGKFRVKDNRPR
jgi:hypothetical protein